MISRFGNRLRSGVFAFGLLSAFSSFASQEFDVETRSGGEILLRGASCDVLDAQVKGLEAWSASLSGGSGLNPAAQVSCLKRPDSEGFSVDISAFFPKRLGEVLKQGKIKEGPNCFGAAFFLGDVVDSLRFVDPAEAHFVLNGPSCEKSSSGRKAVMGEIGVLGREDHAFVWITRDLVFEKPDMKRDSSFRFRAVTDLARDFPCFPRCLTNYRCKRRNGATDGAKNPEIARLLSGVRELECSMAREVVGSSPISQTLRDQMRITLSALKDACLDEMGKNDRSVNISKRAQKQRSEELVRVLATISSLEIQLYRL